MRKLIIEINKNLKSNKSSSHNKIKSLIYNNNSKNLFYKSFIKYINTYKNLNSEIIFHKKLGKFEEIIFELKKFILKILSFTKNLILNTIFAQYVPEKYSFSKKNTLNKLGNLNRKEIKNLLTIFEKNKKRINIKIKKISNGLFNK